MATEFNDMLNYFDSKSVCDGQTDRRVVMNELSLQVFLREHVKQYLDEELYCKLLEKVIVLQSWLRSRWQRRRYLLLHRAVVNVQVNSLQPSS